MSHETWRVQTHKVDRMLAGAITCHQRWGRLGRAINRLMVLRGTDIPPEVKIGSGLILRHGGVGITVHPKAVLGDDVTIYPNVTVGRSDIWRDEVGFGGFRIESHVILCAGAVVLSRGPEALVIAEGSVVGANAVLTQSTGPWEVWAGAPARRVGVRD